MKISIRTKSLVAAVAAVAVAALAAPVALAGGQPTSAEVEARGWAAALGISSTETVDPQTTARYEADAFQRILRIPSVATVTPPEAVAHEAESWTRVVFPGRTPVQVVSQDGFDYRDAAIGAAVALGTALLFAAAMLTSRRHRRLAHL